MKRALVCIFVSEWLLISGYSVNQGNHRLPMYGMSQDGYIKDQTTPIPSLPTQEAQRFATDPNAAAAIAYYYHWPEYYRNRRKRPLEATDNGVSTTNSLPPIRLRFKLPSEVNEMTREKIERDLNDLVEKYLSSGFVNHLEGGTFEPDYALEEVLIPARMNVSYGRGRHSNKRKIKAILLRSPRKSLDDHSAGNATGESTRIKKKAPWFRKKKKYKMSDCCRILHVTESCGCDEHSPPPFDFNEGFGECCGVTERSCTRRRRRRTKKPCCPSFIESCNVETSQCFEDATTDDWDVEKVEGCNGETTKNPIFTSTASSKPPHHSTGRTFGFNAGITFGHVTMFPPFIHKGSSTPRSPPSGGGGSGSTKVPSPTLQSPNESQKMRRLCEEQFKTRCICSMESVLKGFNQIFETFPDEPTVLANVKSFACPQFVPVPAEYKASADKPRLAEKVKQTTVDDGSGPKEVQSDTLSLLLQRESTTREGNDVYVFPGVRLEIPCYTSNEVKMALMGLDSVKYSWSHSNSKSITEGRIKEDESKGTIVIEGVAMDDSDTYICTANYTNPDNHEMDTLVFTHNVAVAESPILTEHILLHYSMLVKCDKALLEAFELFVPQQIETAVCGVETDKTLCTIDVYNALCRNGEIKSVGRAGLYWKMTSQSVRIAREEPNQFVWKLSLPTVKRNRRVAPARATEATEMSLNYEMRVKPLEEFIPQAGNRSRCSPFCYQKIQLVINQILAKSLEDALQSPVRSVDGVKFKPISSALSIRTIISCTAGMQLDQGFCIPCPPDTYSKGESTKCTDCPFGTYQDKMASKSCTDCGGNPFRKGCRHMLRSVNFITMVATLISLLILLAWMVTCCVKACKIKTRKRDASRRRHKRKHRGGRGRHGSPRSRRKRKPGDTSESYEGPQPLPVDFSDV